MASTRLELSPCPWQAREAFGYPLHSFQRARPPGTPLERIEAAHEVRASFSEKQSRGMVVYRSSWITSTFSQWYPAIRTDFQGITLMHVPFIVSLDCMHGSLFSEHISSSFFCIFSPALPVTYSMEATDQFFYRHPPAYR